MKRFSEKAKSKLVQEYLHSGLSCTDFCRKKNLHPNTMYRWKNEIQINNGKRDSFVEINPPMPSEHQYDKSIRITIRNAEIKIPADIKEDQLAKLLTLLGLCHVS